MPIRALFPDGRNGEGFKRDGANFAEMEKEVVLPPYSSFEPVLPALLSRADLLSAATIGAAASAWGLEEREVRRELENIRLECDETLRSWGWPDDDETTRWVLWRCVRGSWEF